MQAKSGKPVSVGEILRNAFTVECLTIEFLILCLRKSLIPKMGASVFNISNI